MKNQLLIFVFALLTLTACKEAGTSADTATEESTEVEVTEETTDHTATFNARMAVLEAFFKAHGDEDLAAQEAMLADTLKFSSPRYSESPWQSKEELMTVLKGYHDNFENIKYTPGIVLPNNTANGYFSGNQYSSDGTVNTGGNAIRCYGTWNATHSESGKAIGVKFFTVASFNDDNKIVMFTDYWNVDGLAAQLAEE
jgi:hypothetical protein